MKKEKRITPADLFFAALLAGELAVLLDAVSVLCGRALSVPKFGAMLMVLFAAILLLPSSTRKRRKIGALVLLAALGIPLAVGTLCWHSVSQNAVYTAVDQGKQQLYGGQKVMLLVPHQDDDINVLGGVMEEYAKYGSELYVVFSTNGDYYDLAEVRIQEAVRALGSIGVPEDHVIFLGYGDQWDREGPHLYNGKPGTVMRSYVGYTQTYGTEDHPSWKVGQDYTVDNFLADLEEVILAHRPDVLYCVDYDYNIDHRALSLSFEKVMGRILKSQADYRPLVFKGYAYNTAWESQKDFYGENLSAVQNVFEFAPGQQPEIYRWAERVRLPVNAESLSRSVISAEQNVTLSMYESQGANMYGQRVINSDKVFWLRDVNSLCLQAQMETSSGSEAILNDFMLLESTDLRERGDMPDDGAWVPESDDMEKQIRVRFAEPVDIRSIVLYDHVDPQKNVLNALIDFEDGTIVETGPLDPGGAASRFAVEKRAVSGFTVTLTQMQGDAGLTEIEAFSQEKWQPGFVKIMDEAGDFVYDYWIDPAGVQRFELYDPSGMAAEFDVFCLNQHCSAIRQENGILVECPAGEFCVVYVTDENGERLDTVYIQNPGRLERTWKQFWLRAEEMVMNLCETERIHERLFVCRMAEKLPAVISRLLG